MLTSPIRDVLDKRDVATIAMLFEQAVKTKTTDVAIKDVAAFRNFVKKVAKLEVKQAGVEVRYVEGQPYDNADEMREDVKLGGMLKISTDFNTSELLPGQLNLDFRTAHDLHHCQTEDCNFELWGECCAFAKFAARANGDAALINILFSEIVAQTCYLRIFGEFPDQAVLGPSLAKWAVQVCQAYEVPYNG